MNLKNKKMLWIVAIFIFAIGPAIGSYFAAPYYKLMTVGNAMNAMTLCSSTFISGRNAADILNQDLAPYKSFPMQATIDYNQNTVTSTFWGLATRKAIYREGGGCTAILETTEEELRSQRIAQIEHLPANSSEVYWPTGDLNAFDLVPKGVNMVNLTKVVERAFSEPDVEKPRWTRAIVVVYRGKIIAESYAPDITKDTAHIGWSMSKSVTSALIGILIGQDKLSLDKRAPIEEWSTAGDRRRRITLKNLLQMSSGLGFIGSSSASVNDTSKMLFDVKDAGRYATGISLAHEPGHWEYANGNTVILNEIIQRTLGNEKNSVFPRKALFNKIGMRSAVINLDPSGAHIGSVFMYASARDWARFGLLYLNDGVWEGERILPKDWVAFTLTPISSFTKESGGYGAQFWTNKPYDEKNGKLKWPAVPIDAFYLGGHQGQYVVIIPSRQLIVVRLGMTHKELEAKWDMGEFMTDLLNAVE